MTIHSTHETPVVTNVSRRGDVVFLKLESIDDLINVVKRAEASLQNNGDDAEVDIDDLPETELIATSTKMVAVLKTTTSVVMA